MIKKVQRDGSFQGIKIVKNVTVIHVQFADDTLIFINNDVGSIKLIKQVLICFRLLSGLKINFQKSKLYSCGAGVSLFQEGGNILPCPVGDWPMSYLGVTVGLSPKRKFFGIP